MVFEIKMSEILNNAWFASISKMLFKVGSLTDTVVSFPTSRKSVSRKTNDLKYDTQPMNTSYEAVLGSEAYISTLRNILIIEYFNILGGLHWNT